MKPFRRSLLVWTAILVFAPYLFIGCGTNSSYKAPITYTIGGTVTNLVANNSVVLYDNAGDSLTVNGTTSASVPFTFATAVASGGAYAVTVHTQPTTPVQNCQVTNGSGMASANVTNVQVACAAVTFTIGGTVTNLVSGNSVMLSDNGGDTLTVNGTASASVPFTFATAVASGGAYAVTVHTQPTTPGQNCQVTNGDGMASANVTNVTVNCAHGEWTWMGGTQNNQNGNYPAMVGTASPGNIPGSRFFGAATWTDASGNLWLFGGAGLDSVGTNAATGGGDMNDLWEYTVNNGVWTWKSGSNLIGQQGSYGSQGVEISSNVPGARDSGVSWTDTSGNLWLFGGQGPDSTGTFNYFNDLWKYNITSGKWTWVSGTNQLNQPGVYGAASTTNFPGARLYGVSWTDTSGNLWLFGGLGYDSVGTTTGDMNDLWKYNLSTGVWTWVSGSNVMNQNGMYPTMVGTASPGNVPGAREGAASWIDTSGNLWLIGGFGLGSTGSTPGYINDMWEYTTSNNQWTWVSGANSINQNGAYGTKGMPALATTNFPGARRAVASWIDTSGNLWLLGGFGFGSTASGSSAGDLNDLWEYSISAKTWTWMSGVTSINPSGTYGTLGTPDPSNVPSGRDSVAYWTDKSGNFWLFSGIVNTSNPNDLWMYLP